MPTAKMKQKRKRAREAFETLFPHGARGITCGPAQRERHSSKAVFHQLAMQSPAQVLAHLQD